MVYLSKRLPLLAAGLLCATLCLGEQPIASATHPDGTGRKHRVGVQLGMGTSQLKTEIPRRCFNDSIIESHPRPSYLLGPYLQGNILGDDFRYRTGVNLAVFGNRLHRVGDPEPRETATFTFLQLPLEVMLELFLNIHIEAGVSMAWLVDRRYDRNWWALDTEYRRRNVIYHLGLSYHYRNRLFVAVTHMRHNDYLRGISDVSLYNETLDTPWMVRVGYTLW